MVHRPFEDWLLDEEPLSTEKAVALQEHLQGCSSCRQLSQAWKEVEVDLRTSPVLAPRTGFTNRWQARLEADRRRLHRRQSAAALGFSLGGAVLLLGSLSLLALPVLATPKLLLWAWVLHLIELISYTGDLQEIILSVFNIQSRMIPTAWWILLVGFFSMLVVVWIVSLRYFTTPRRVIE
jgi:predicted anti-sigma-YlaC factor YlaD